MRGEAAWLSVDALAGAVKEMDAVLARGDKDVLAGGERFLAGPTQGHRADPFGLGVDQRVGAEMFGELMKPATNSPFGLLWSSSGDPACITEPLSSTTILLAMVIASTWSWVTWIIVVFNALCSSPVSTCICTRKAASWLESGSWNRSALGSRTIARPMATRWRWPPES
jgi:hypothetical protein